MEKANQRGIYVDVMLFEGFGLHLTPPPDNVEGHPFHAKNNVNGIGISSIVDYMVLPLDPTVRGRCRRRTSARSLDTVHDLPNVLYEVANEASGQDADGFEMAGQTIPGRIGDTTAVAVLGHRDGQAPRAGARLRRAPIGMTMQFPVPDQHRVNEPLFASPADWISPGFDEPIDPNADFSGGPPQGRWFTDPPEADGRKVIISDTDHYSPMQSDALWAWKSFMRGHNPILYDLGIIGGVNPDDPSAGFPSYESLEAARLAMGDTRRLAERIDLAGMVPHPSLSSTRYALAANGQEYVVFQPDEGGFTVELPPGTYVGRVVQPGGSLVGRWRRRHRGSDGHDILPATIGFRRMGAAPDAGWPARSPGRGPTRRFVAGILRSIRHCRVGEGRWAATVAAGRRLWRVRPTAGWRLAAGAARRVGRPDDEA